MTDTPIKLVPPSYPEPSASLISLIESILEDAKSGRLRSYVATGIMNDGSRMSGWHTENCESVWPLMGAVSLLPIEFAKKYIQESKPE